MHTLGRLLVVRLVPQDDVCDRNKAYATHMGLKLAVWAETIRNAHDRPVSLCETLDYFARARKEMAEQADSQNRDAFGLPRNIEMVTPISDQFAAYQERARVVLGNAVTYTFVEQGIALTRLALSGTRLEWRHTQSLIIRDCIQQMDRLWRVAQAAALGDHLGILAQLHWWGAHAMPFRRGSASIVDASIRSLQISRGWPLREWRRRIAPDCEALVSTLSEFCELYGSLHQPSCTERVRGWLTGR